MSQIDNLLNFVAGNSENRKVMSSVDDGGWFLRALTCRRLFVAADKQRSVHAEQRPAVDCRCSVANLRGFAYARLPRVIARPRMGCSASFTL